ncbi:hypothetical protein SRHO_G00017250 [Serrasalmus rhombeus]
MLILREELVQIRFICLEEGNSKGRKQYRNLLRRFLHGQQRRNTARVTRSLTGKLQTDLSRLSESERLGKARPSAFPRQKRYSVDQSGLLLTK